LAAGETFAIWRGKVPARGRSSYVRGNIARKHRAYDDAALTAPP